MSGATEPTGAEQRRSVRQTVHGSHSTVDDKGVPRSDPNRRLAYIVNPPCRPESAAILLARIVNISREGLGLHVGECFERGTMLTLALRNGVVKISGVQAQVVHVLEQANGTWLIGLEFAQPLDDAFLKPFSAEPAANR